MKSFLNKERLKMSLNDLATSSNERREQRIMLLRKGFNEEKYNTISEAAEVCGYSYNTVKKWAIDGDIPLLDINGKPIVQVTQNNKRVINPKIIMLNIKILSNLFNSKKAITVTACSKYLKYPEATVVAWAIDGNIPLLTRIGKPVVPLSNENKPNWLKR